MKKFAYQVQDKDAQVLEGILEALSEEQASGFLASQNYEVLSLKPIKDSFNVQNLIRNIETVNQVQLNFFVRQLATLLKAGVPMLATLQTLQEGVKDNVLRRVVGDMYDDVEQGSSFSEAIGRHPKTFTALFVATVRSGEAIGELDTVLNRLADILEKDYNTNQKIKSAMRYPVLAFSVLGAAFTIATVFIIPQFETLFSSLGADLPLPTRILLFCSDITINYWYFLVAGVVAAGIFFIYHYKTRSGRRFWDAVSLHVPVMGDFIRNALYSRFSRMLGLMIQSGVNLLPALELIADIVDNSVFMDHILEIKESVAGGETLSGQMREAGIFQFLWFR